MKESGGTWARTEGEVRERVQLWSGAYVSEETREEGTHTAHGALRPRQAEGYPFCPNRGREPSAGMLEGEAKLAVACSLWDLSSQTRDCSHAPSIGRAVLTTGPPGKSLFSPLFLLVKEKN